ncbi:MAG: hypothetical protein LBH05_01555 [Deferribacteraceae bacterium]|jgi:hypothetical protein|nr:hypothetical protein [Deferribacteraceae bacterium]
MLKINGITNYPMQRHIIPFEKGRVILRLRFYGHHEFWTMGVEYGGKNVYGIKLSLGVLHLKNNNYPFDFMIEDTSNTGIDPFMAEDFMIGRINLYMLEAEDLIG